ncbi:hypothetical protein HG826_15080 [Streptomyces sp. GMY01]|uniref:hypothetical protein n=1 Tax=Streptomyces sp. GMY02 TaxID=1333528 RepID=UPI00146D530F|nr:hypothetical protein [Streptomyces sp. GMY02]NMO34870.1 hypothetical protein [Streptomyces sp. GMY02]
MDEDRHVCPVCGQTLGTVVRRHKTLGVWVPVRRPGPCRNPDCGSPPQPPPTRSSREQPDEPQEPQEPRPEE